MKVLITGGAGFIGSHLVERLLDSGAAVRILDNLSTGKRENLPLGPVRYEFVHGDIRNETVVAESVRGMDVVVHLAAVASVQASIDNPIETHQSNFDGTLNLLEASRQHGVKRFLYASSAAVYGDTTQLPVSEQATPQPLSPYAVDKLSGEYYLRYYYRKFGLAGTSFRFFNIYGPRQDPSSPYSGVISIFVDRLRRNQPVTLFGDGTQTRDFVYVDDLVALLAATTNDARGAGEAVNVGTGKPHSLLQLLGQLESLSGKKLVKHYEPARTGDIQHSYADITRLKNLYGLVPATDFGRGLRQLIG